MKETKPMRTYPCTSPEAAARLVALVLIADGHVCRTELDTLERIDAARELGLQPDALPRIVQTLCEDLLLGADASGSLVANIDERALEAAGRHWRAVDSTPTATGVGEIAAERVA